MAFNKPNARVIRSLSWLLFWTLIALSASGAETNAPVAVSGDYSYRATYEAKTGDQALFVTRLDADAAFATGSGASDPAGKPAPCEGLVSRLNLSQSGPNGSDIILVSGGDCLRVSDSLVVIDTATGIGTDRAYSIRRLQTGRLDLSGTGGGSRDWAPDVFGMLGLFLPPVPPVSTGETQSVIARARRLADWRLQLPQPVRLQFSRPSGERADRIEIGFRLSLVGSDEVRRFDLTSYSGRPLVIGAAVGRGQGELIVDPKTGRLLSASLSGSIMVTIPGETENKRLTITFNETIKAR
jgi:hypothetical protein